MFIVSIAHLPTSTKNLAGPTENDRSAVGVSCYLCEARHNLAGKCANTNMLNIFKRFSSYLRGSIQLIQNTLEFSQ